MSNVPATVSLLLFQKIIEERAESYRVSWDRQCDRGYFRGYLFSLRVMQCHYALAQKRSNAHPESVLHRCDNFFLHIIVATNGRKYEENRESDGKKRELIEWTARFVPQRARSC